MMKAIVILPWLSIKELGYGGPTGRYWNLFSKGCESEGWVICGR
jgi:hypothetical protein